MFKTAVDPLKLELFLEINNLLNSSFYDVNLLFTKILEFASRLTDGEASSLMLLHPETQNLQFIVALGSKGEAVKSYTLKRGEGIAGWVAENNTSLIVNDVEKDNRFFAAISQNIGFPTRTILAVPLRVKGQCVGVVEMINKKNGAYFSDEDLTWLEVFSNQAGLALQNARSWKAMQDELQVLREVVHNNQTIGPLIIGQSPQITEVLQLAKKYALTDSTVLITGESGTGKELVAEYIHYQSLRSRKPLIRINCASLPEHLLESELFGHVRGAFTDAIQDKLGKFELAQGGTIFLDEVAELTLPLQAKLLRVLQSRTIERLGSLESFQLDVRIIVATNKDLVDLVDKGNFRKDLYYRLHVLPIHVPPLRERKSDIPLLIDFFMKDRSQVLHINAPKFSAEAILHLQEKKWIGNIRELINTVERILVLCNCDVVEVEMLVQMEGGSNVENYENSDDLKSAVNSFKTAFIRKVLDRVHGNQTKAAQILGIQRTYLSKLVKELSIEN